MPNNLTLLASNEPPSFIVERENGQSQFFLICDHASNRIPERLRSLGVPSSELQRHIAWDIGVKGVTATLGAQLDAFSIYQNYSRLVVDCNRPIGSPGSIVTVSEHTPIPGNENLSAAQRKQREDEIYWPYHHRIRAELDARAARQQTTILVSMHSFTPEFKSQTRTMHAGVLYQRDARLAHRVLQLLRADPELTVGDNEPYSVSDLTDYAIPEYGEKRGLLHVEIEIRQDLIDHAQGQLEWAQRMAKVLTDATATWML
jgi:predicted N-formylglutamate amidohydrolase